MSEQSDVAFEAWIDHPLRTGPRGFRSGERTAARAGWDAAVAYQKAQDLGEALDDLAQTIQSAIEEWLDEQ